MSHIEQLLEQFPRDQRHVRFTFDWNSAGYTVCAQLTLPTGHIMAQTDMPVPDNRAAIDEVVDKLAAEVSRHNGELRKNGDQRVDRKVERMIADSHPWPHHRTEWDSSMQRNPRS